MGSALKLEVFAQSAAVASATWMTSEQIEAARQAAFEEGYASGWQDSTDQLNTGRRSADEAFEASLQGLAFTHEEVRRELMTALHPLIMAMTTAILPTIARHGLPGMVADLIAENAGGMIAEPLLLTCHPDDQDILETKLEGLALPPLRVVAEPALASGQISRQWPDHACSVDLARLLDATRHAVETFFEARNEENSDD
ncbi:hypothetical protein [Roseicitreum antarcticum]|uniref:Flagellar assembly protein FliH n=1 Tax=Roseicitreum antarcticum TaxID=564137 RepID=A0A1H2URL0_9RHOB|nr:hypothetical protein [Roseicitreum antarcticum]SDW58732.1 flagellar assembly protein FliH [Roseicitreum antarcticum]